jgi:hypothetical protein
MRANPEEAADEEDEEKEALLSPLMLGCLDCGRDATSGSAELMVASIMCRVEVLFRTGMRSHRLVVLHSKLVFAKDLLRFLASCALILGGLEATSDERRATSGERRAASDDGVTAQKAGRMDDVARDDAGSG